MKENLERFIREEFLLERRGGKPYEYSSADFADSSKTFTVEKKGNPVSFKVSKGEDVQTKEGKINAPEGHIIVTRHSVKGSQPDTYPMSREKFHELHSDVDEKAGTARQKGVRKPAIIAHRDGVFRPSWSKTPLKVTRGHMVVNNGGPHDPKNPHTDVANVAGHPNDPTSVAGQTYKIVKN
jgi:hypothetical protein